MSPRNGVKARLFIAPTLKVKNPDELKTVGSLGTFGGIGFTEVKATGKKLAHLLRISTGDGTRNATGERRDHTETVKAEPAAVKKLVRRVRPEELAKLEAADAEIEKAEAALKAARLARAEIAHEAWLKGHVVPVKELKELIGS